MESVEAFGLLALRLPEAALLVDRSGKLLAVNSAAAELLGHPAERIRGSALAAHAAVDDTPLDRALHEVLDTQSARTVAIRFGSVKPGNSVACQLLPLDGEKVLIHAVIPQDYASKIAALELEVRERKRAEQQRDESLMSERAARAELERAARVKDEFLATLSHELRTPLNAILGWAQYLQTAGIDAEETREGLDTIERNAKLQTELVNDLLDMSRIISGTIHLEVKPTSVAAAIRAAVETVRPAAAAKAIGLTVDIAEGEASCRVLGDPVRLQQIVWNLLSNAVKFTPTGGRVTVALGQREGLAELTVTDTGLGIKEDFLEFVFDRFRQADSSTTRRHGGLGIGLAVVRHLVELHGGAVRVQSAGSGKGATFTVTLPAPAERDPRWQEEIPSSSARLDGVRVLMVEDDPDLRRLLLQMLRQKGAEVWAASSSAAALELLRDARPDVILSDIGMAGEDGYAFIQKVRGLAEEEGGKTPAIAVTGYVLEDDRAKTLASGFNRHMVKPVAPERLIGAILELLPKGGGTFLLKGGGA